MADVNFSLGQVNILDYLVVICYRASDPHAEIQRWVSPLGPPATSNVTFLGLDPDKYLFSVYESPNAGVTLTTLFNIWEIDAASNRILSEYRFYHVNGAQSYDPATDAVAIVDPYLTGKTVAAFNQRGTGALVPTDEWTRTVDGIGLVANIFAVDDIYYAVITYSVDDGSGGTARMVGPFGPEVDIVASLTMDSTYDNKCINCIGASTRLVITIRAVADIPDGTHLYFNDQRGGVQLQTKILCQAGEFIKRNGQNFNELWVGKSEFLWLKKSGGNLVVHMEGEGIKYAGRRFSGLVLTYINSLPEDGALYDADDYPRIWWWLVTQESSYLDNNVDQPDGVYVRPPNRQGQFIYSTSKRKFRMPNSQNGLSEKGLLDYHVRGSDVNRPIDIPGGFQGGAVKKHDHIMHGGGTIPALNLYLSRTNGGSQPHRFSGGGGDGLGGTPIPDVTMRTSIEGSDFNIVDNVGVIYTRCV